MALFYFTLFHSLIAVAALGFGLVAILGLLGAPIGPVWTRLFVTLSLATTATGFMFPLPGVTPAVVVGALSTLVFGAMLTACIRRFAGRWLTIYQAGLVLQAYLLAFVAAAQAFTKIPALQQAAPTLSEAPFAATQAVLLAVYFGLGLAVVRGRHVAQAIS